MTGSRRSQRSKTVPSNYYANEQGLGHESEPDQEATPKKRCEERQGKGSEWLLTQTSKEVWLKSKKAKTEPQKSASGFGANREHRGDVQAYVGEGQERLRERT